jgi:photosystem II stability/assembly factor-like uncharacterized protein
MRSTLWLPALFVACTLPAFAQWQLQTPNTTADLRGIHSVGGGVAWASGTHGTVLRTEDGGYAWQNCTVPPGAEKLDFRGIQAFDANTAIVMSSGPGDQSRLYKTTDGCRTWKLVFTNPDKDGFWDAFRFHKSPDTVTRFPNQLNGYLIGDPVDGNFVIYRTLDSGQTWTRWRNDDTERPAVADKGAGLFAASNTCLLIPGYNGPFAFVSGGISGSVLYTAQPHSPLDAYWLAFSKIDLPFPKGDSAGAFSIEARFEQDSPFPDLMVVGGDYKRPEQARQNAFFLPAPKHPLAKKVLTPTTPPHGYRSSVAYDPELKFWITVGPNGTDISTDDGKNWRAVHPDSTQHEAPDADHNWNAISLPYVVGPKGRIGRLDPEAIKAALRH